MGVNLFYIFLLTLMGKALVDSSDVICTKRVYLSRAEQIDDNGLKCWDNVKVPSCGGRCDSREVRLFIVYPSLTVKRTKWNRIQMAFSILTYKPLVIGLSTQVKGPSIHVRMKI